jgi:hypothetical protein
MDRMSLRDQMQGNLGWPEPEGEKPDYQVWRNRADVTPSEEILSPFSPGGINTGRPSSPSCRSIRGFVALKSLDPS